MTSTSPILSNAYLEIDTKAIIENIQYLKSLVSDQVKLMVMVKAFGYGHGSIECSKFLEKHELADYLAVASIQKGMDLRAAGIELPIMVTNPIQELFDEMVKHCIEPTIHHLEHLKSFIAYLENNGLENYPIHLKFNTGMNRFGFDIEELDEVIELCKIKQLRISSVMSHLSSADLSTQDEFTLNQIEQFSSIKSRLTPEFKYHINFHILNSHGIIRFPEYAMDMVRSGIAVFGVTETIEGREQLKPAARLKSRVAQIRTVKAGDSLSYSRSAIVEEDKNIAIIACGYADGFPRSLSKGKWEVEINGQLFPTIGNVCMDYTLIDISRTKSPIKVGDEVIIFGNLKSINDFAEAQSTISYEALTNLGQIVDRLFV